MKYSIIHDLEDNFLAVVLDENLNLGDFKTMLDEVGSTILETNCYDLLVDATPLKVNLSFLDLTALPGLMSSVIRTRQLNASALRWAVVLPQSSNVRELHQVIADYFGGAMARFQNREDALRWLKENRNN